MQKIENNEEVLSEVILKENKEGSDLRIRWFYIKLILIIIISPILYLILHEIFHGISALLTGNEFHGIIIRNESKDNEVFNLVFSADITFINENSYIVVMISGSVGTSIVSIIILLFMRIKQTSNFTMKSSSITNLLHESFYLFLSPILRKGDLYIALSELSLLDNRMYFSLFFFVLYIVFLIWVITVFKKKISKK